MAAWNVRLRFGLKNDGGSKLSNKVKPALKTGGLADMPNGSWGGDNLDAKKVAAALKEMVDYLADPTTTPADADAALTTLWLHIEKHDKVAAG